MPCICYCTTYYGKWNPICCNECKSLAAVRQRRHCPVFADRGFYRPPAGTRCLRRSCEMFETSSIPGCTASSAVGAQLVQLLGGSMFKDTDIPILTQVTKPLADCPGNVANAWAEQASFLPTTPRFVSSHCPARRQYQLRVTGRKAPFTSIPWNLAFGNQAGAISTQWKGKSDLHLGPDVSQSRKQERGLTLPRNSCPCRSALPPARSESGGVGTGWEGQPLWEEEALGENQPSTARIGGRGWWASLLWVRTMCSRGWWPRRGQRTLRRGTAKQWPCSSRPWPWKGAPPRWYTSTACLPGCWRTSARRWTAWATTTGCGSVRGACGEVGWCSSGWWGAIGAQSGSMAGTGSGRAQGAGRAHSCLMQGLWPGRCPALASCRQGVPMHHSGFGIKWNCWLIGGIPDFCVCLASLPSQASAPRALPFSTPLSALYLLLLPVFASHRWFIFFFLPSPHVYSLILTAPIFLVLLCPVSKYRKCSPWGFYSFFYIPVQAVLTWIFPQLSSLSYLTWLNFIQDFTNSVYWVNSYPSQTCWLRVGFSSAIFACIKLCPMSSKASWGGNRGIFVPTLQAPTPLSFR